MGVCVLKETFIGTPGLLAVWSGESGKDVEGRGWRQFCSIYIHNCPGECWESSRFREDDCKLCKIMSLCLLKPSGNPNYISFTVKLCSFSCFVSMLHPYQTAQVDGASKIWLLWIANAFHNKEDISLWGPLYWNPIFRDPWVFEAALYTSTGRWYIECW